MRVKIVFVIMILVIILVPVIVYAENDDLDDIKVELESINEKLDRVDEYVNLLFEDKDIDDMKILVDRFVGVKDDDGEEIEEKEFIDINDLLNRLDKVLGWMEQIGVILFFLVIVVLPLVVFVVLGWILLKQFF